MDTERYALLLRGVNVGGVKLPMAPLRTALADAGYANVATYIQSGNIVLDAAADDATVAEGVGAIITERFGLQVPVIVRRHGELLGVVERNPFPQHTDEPAKLSVGFAPVALPTEFTPVEGSVDQVAIIGREVYFYCPNGMGRAKLPKIERRGAPPVTVRNWNTVLKLCSMTEP
ncbi:MAG: DUF1697 domain-containing protein [Acidimicrobiales bacterium]